MVEARTGLWAIGVACVRARGGCTKICQGSTGRGCEWGLDPG